MAVAIHLAQTGNNLDYPVLAQSYLAKAAATWTDILTTAAIRREVDWPEKRATADGEHDEFAAECRAKAARLRVQSDATTDPVFSRELLMKAVRLEQDAIHGRAVAEQREAQAMQRERDAEKRAIERARWEREWRNR